QRSVEGDCLRNAPLRDETLDALHDEIGDGSFHGAQQIAELRDDHMLERGVRQGLLNDGGEVFQDQNGFGAAIGELPLEFSCGVERTAIDHDIAASQRAEERNRILEDVWHHQRDAHPSFELQLSLKIAAERPRKPIELGESHRGSHLNEGRVITELLDASVKHLAEGAESVDIDFRWNAGGIALDPKSFHMPSSPWRRSRFVTPARLEARQSAAGAPSDT